MTAWVLLVLALIAWRAVPAAADLSLETETARLLPPGHFEFSTAFEYQKSSNGEEYDTPLALEFGLIDRVEVLIEPVPYTSIRAPGGPAATGLGDLEITLQYLLLHEKKYIPAIVGAFEVKIPTARNLQIGDRVTDYRLYLVASKRWGDFDFHANVGYNIVGQPANVKTKNPIDLEFAVEWFAHPKFDVFGEINYIDSSRGSGGGGTASTGEGGAAAAGRVRHFAADAGDGSGAGTGTALNGRLTAEIAGTEILGTLGTRYHLRPDVDLFGSVSYDNFNAVLYRIGVTYKW